ncbi:hypothetical protein CAAN1_02S01728 [[Candida] anglica]|uniref:Uncharacterized protein n=1 Tax=[Candida] anglica TaxID=148631 RepID=A0ABP0E6G9_9ASCO
MIAMESLTGILLPCIIALYVAAWLYLRKIFLNQTSVPLQNEPTTIEAIGEDFDWEKAEPRPIRPFKGKKIYKINMGISNLAQTPEDWLLIENSYLKSIEIRKSVTTEFPKNTVYVHNSPETHLAVREFYDKVLKYMCERYPQYFAITEKGHVHNKITSTTLPIASETDPRDLILSLAANIEEDFLILMKDNPSDPDEEYKSRASLTGFPAGFDPSEGHNKPISFIHSPVPQYESKLKLSMGKFFNRLESKDLWCRHNWSIQTHKARFSLANNHAYEGQKVEQLKYEDIDFEEGAFLRVERQILTRLPHSRANIMTVRTFLTPLKQIKEEGLSNELCDAIDGLPDDVAFYKKRGAWGEAVKQYLREP